MKFFQKLILPIISVVFLLSGVQAQQSLPQFSFSDLDGKTFTSAQLRSDIPTIVFFFDPYCEHCQQQATWMKEAKNQLTNVQQVWVTTEEPISARDFGKKYLGEGWDNVHILIDKQFLFDGYFGYSEIPSIYLYNNQGQRVKAFNKETPADVLLRFL